MARTRSAAAHSKVIAAAIELFADRGIDGASMDAIAVSSGVSKATIYKHWADKEALLLEVMEHLAGIDSRPNFDSGDVRADILAALTFQPSIDGEARSRMMPHLIAYSARNQAFGQLWRRRVMEHPRKDLRRLLQQAIKLGELSKIDLDLAATMLLGPMLYWHLALRSTQSDPRPIAAIVVDTLWRAYGKNPPASGPPRSSRH